MVFVPEQDDKVQLLRIDASLFLYQENHAFYLPQHPREALTRNQVFLCHRNNAH